MLLSIFMTVSSFDWIWLSLNIPPNTISLSQIKYNKYVSESISKVVGFSNLEELCTKLSFKCVDNCNALARFLWINKPISLFLSIAVSLELGFWRFISKRCHHKSFVFFIWFLTNLNWSLPSKNSSFEKKSNFSILVQLYLLYKPYFQYNLCLNRYQTC